MNSSFRIEPGNLYGFHIVDVENGGERVFILYTDLDNLIQNLRKINFKHKFDIDRPELEDILK